MKPNAEERNLLNLSSLRVKKQVILSFPKNSVEFYGDPYELAHHSRQMMAYMQYVEFVGEEQRRITQFIELELAQGQEARKTRRNGNGRRRLSNR